jgi:hypothetical protein
VEEGSPLQPTGLQSLSCPLVGSGSRTQPARDFTTTTRRGAQSNGKHQSSRISACGIATLGPSHPSLFVVFSPSAADIVMKIPHHGRFSARRRLYHPVYISPFGCLPMNWIHERGDSTLVVSFFAPCSEFLGNGLLYLQISKIVHVPTSKTQSSPGSLPNFATWQRPPIYPKNRREKRSTRTCTASLLCPPLPAVAGIIQIREPAHNKTLKNVASPPNLTWFPSHSA